jgi:PAS domain S-box-containing protein
VKKTPLDAPLYPEKTIRSRWVSYFPGRVSADTSSRQNKSPYPTPPETMQANWQRILDLLANTIDVPAALIMRVHTEEIEVFAASQTKSNPYKQGERAKLNTGLYCEAVIARRGLLHIPNALKNPNWAQNPDLKLGMVSYLGYPLIWPDGKIFGTICVLDSSEHPYSETHQHLMLEFSNIINDQLKTLTATAEKELRFQKLTASACAPHRPCLCLAVSTIIGTATLCFFSTIQKLMIGAPISPKGYLVPVVFGGVTGAIVGLILTKTARRTKELNTALEALQESELRLRKLSDNLPGGMTYQIDTGPDGTLRNITYVSAGVEKLHGLTAEAVCQNAALFYNQILKEDQAYIAEQEKRAIASMSTFSAEARIKIPSGETRWHLFTSAPRQAPNGHLIWDGIEIDITERKEAEEARNESLARFSGFAQASQYGMGMADLDGQIVYVNNTLARMLGEISADNCKGKHFPSTYYPPEINRKLTEEVLPTLMSTESWHGELELQSIDGQRIPTDENYFIIRNDNGEPVYIADILTDISGSKQTEREHHELEEQLRHSQKMEAIGQLAGGVAHDFNNILQALMGEAEVALLSQDPDEPTRAALESIMKSGKRAADLVRQLLAFSRKQVFKIETVHLNTIIQNLSKMIRRVIGEHIEVQTLLAPDLHNTRADCSQLEQILMNLCVNARDAMPNGGTLTIRTENTPIDETTFHNHAWATTPGSYVLLAVADNGCGMDEFTRSHLFEPFFTTKGLANGTGLGLATIYGIVQQHQGIIEVHSEPDIGTEFRIYLPIDENAPSAISPDKNNRSANEGTETILLAEDDPFVRNLSRQVLETSGYTVFAAENGEEAIRLFDEHADEIDLALLDVIMPKLGGKAVYEHIQNTCPKTRVLFASGYNSDISQNGFMPDENMQLIQKPYHWSVMLETIRTLLDS